ncbi:MAG: aminodeoxychorismate synthase component I [Campylobacterota bacterium]|nr:aminodeoxychorismate synthase component I [Campylobacterota bacterium]
MNLKERLNYYGSINEPFLFIIDFDMTNYEVIPLKNLPNNISYSIDETSRYTKHNITLLKKPIDYKNYKIKFNKIQNEIREGNSYLLNLTSITDIKTSHNLRDIYENANAKFKLYFKDQFTCFSPERFCNIKNNKIYTYPMKGTIDADIKDAKNIILNDKKELAEHTMVVDLLRNDLSIVSSKVTVEDFRYCEKIYAGNKELYQISSKISGQLEKNWNHKLGDIITSMLPAGSITGTPKKKTVEIIKRVEEYDRDYFTGVFGVYDGLDLDSAVMIRFIQKNKDGSMEYKSGGGITCDSDIKSEYNEMIDKVYIP